MSERGAGWAFVRLRSAAAWKEAEGAPRVFRAPGAAEKRRLLPRALGGWARRPLSPAPPTGTALQCYSCKAQTSNEDCLHVENCSLSETHCWTERIRAIGVLTILSKGCSSSCEDDTQNYYLGAKNVTCCSSSLCNASAAHAPRPALGPLLLLAAAACSLMLWGPSQL